VAHEQLVAFCAMAADVARNHGITLVVEPLNRGECNVLNTVSECAALVREVAHPSLRLLVDAYHLLKDGDACSDVVANGELLRHAHIATPEHRLAPGAEPCDFAEFFASLARVNYRHGVSVEARIADPVVDLPRALALMRRLLADAASPR
jgi:sugar phosphate isomerase/epimerase